MNKKMIRWMFVMVALVLASVTVGAALVDAGLGSVEGFFSGGWMSYEKTITFVTFFFLFFTAFLIGMKKSMGDLSRAHMTFAFAAAFLSSFIIVMTMGFSWMNLGFLAWILIGVLVLFALYALLGKMGGMENKKLLAFIIALILTLLLLWLIWHLMHDGLPFSGMGKVTDAFSGFGKGSGSGKKRSWFSFSRPSTGGGDPVSVGPGTPGQADGPPIIGDKDDPDTEGVKEKSKVKWWMVVVPIVILLGGFGLFRRRRAIANMGRRRRGRRLRRRLRRLIADTNRILAQSNISARERQQAMDNLDRAVQLIRQIRQGI